MKNCVKTLGSIILCSVVTSACIRGEFRLHRAAKSGAVEGKAFKLTSPDCIDPDLSQVAKDVSMTLCNGTTAQGTYTVHTACTLDGQEQCNVEGNYKAADTTKFTANDLVVGAVYAGVAGTHKFSRCRNGVNGALYNANGLPGTGAQTDGGSYEWWDTIDEYNGSTGYVANMSSGDAWGSEFYCSGSQYSSVTNSTSWLTPTAVAPQGLYPYCAASGTGTCTNAAQFSTIVHDAYTNLYVTNTLCYGGGAAAQWCDFAEAHTMCTLLDSGDGQNKWRMPTLKELYALYNDGFYGISASLLAGGLNNIFWTGTTVSTTTTNGYIYAGGSAYSTGQAKTSGTASFCVRSP